MSDLRRVLARNVTEVGLFAGISIMILSGVVGLESISSVGVVVLLAGIFLDDAIASLLEPPGNADADTEWADPVEELRERYARGEIDREEFDRRLDNLLETDPEMQTKGPTADELDREFDRR
ncbi:MAG: putative membrane protein [Halobacteriales archaeon]|jgi:uncharacterized membrane protein